MTTEERIKAARHAKVETIAAWMDVKGFSAEVAAAMNEAHWTDVAAAAGVRPPSAESRLLVIGRLVELRTSALLAADQPQDPFRRFGKAAQ